MSASAKVTRKQRPTRPQLQSLFNQLILCMTRREMALLLWCLGEGGTGKDLAEQFLSTAEVAK